MAVQGLDLVFVAVYQNMLNVPFVDALLALLKNEFAHIYRPKVYAYKNFDDRYKVLLGRVQQQAVFSKNRVMDGGGRKTSQSQVLLHL